MITRVCRLLALISNAAWAVGTLVINANVITGEKDHPSAPACAIEKGGFTAVWNDASWPPILPGSVTFSFCRWATM